MSKKVEYSICILSYNRPKLLARLLRSIDTNQIAAKEIIICDDCSPKLKLIRREIEIFKNKSTYNISLHVNSSNKGYDFTFNRLINLANGRWIIFMGDDDEFVSKSLDKLFRFLKSNSSLGYVMKSHKLIHNDIKTETVEDFRYFDQNKFYQPGILAYTDLFRRSVFISGFIIRSKYALEYQNNLFDGSLLSQLYLLAEVTLKYPSAYFDEPITQQYSCAKYDLNDQMIDRKSKNIIKRVATVEMSINFLSGFKKIATYIDKKYNIKSWSIIQLQMSKYSYPNLSIHRDKGLKVFYLYILSLINMGFNKSFYFYIYIFALTLFGKKICDCVIMKIKKKLGRTPIL